MYTDDNNSNNDKDGEEKKKYTINDKKTMGIKTLYLTEGKIRIRQGFKSGNWGIRVIAPSGQSLTFLFCFPTKVFNRKTMSFQQEV